MIPCRCVVPVFLILMVLALPPNLMFGLTEDYSDNPARNLVRAS